LKRWLVLLAPLFAAACGDEGPTDVGAGLLPPDAVRTFEIILEPHQYLVFDTAFSQYSDPAGAPYVVAANAFEGALFSNALVRFTMPTALSVTDTAGVARLDTLPIFTGATIRVLVDTLRSTAPPAELAMFRVAEAWDGSATWTHRVDTADVRIPWATPGGTRGVQMAEATWVERGDTLIFQVDSATVAAWRQDTAALNRGAMIVSRTPDSRLRMGTPTMTVQARSTFRPDTVFELAAGTIRRTFVFTPAPALAASAPRVGGTPAWRGVLRIRERMDTLTFACPGVPNCRIRLDQAALNHAGLMLQPVPSPAGFSPESGITVAAYLLNPTPLVPLQRSPLAEFIGSATMTQASFVAGAPIRELGITEMIRRAILPPEQWPAGAQPPTHLALNSLTDPPLFGFASFASMPRLRLVVSTTREMQLP
jgi:hypothetical protein